MTSVKPGWLISVSPVPAITTEAASFKIIVLLVHDSHLHITGRHRQAIVLYGKHRRHPVAPQRGPAQSAERGRRNVNPFLRTAFTAVRKRLLQ